MLRVKTLNELMDDESWMLLRLGTGGGRRACPWQTPEGRDEFQAGLGAVGRPSTLFSERERREPVGTPL